MAGGKGIRIPIIADVAAFITGMRKAEVTAEDLADALDDMAADGIKGQQRLQRELDETAREARRATDKIAKDGKDRLGSAGGEVGKEFSQSFGESLRSGNPLEAFTETATNLGGLFGPAGLAAAAGVGALTMAIGGARAEIEKAKERADDWYTRLTEIGATLTATWKDESIQAAIKQLGGGFTAEGWIIAERSAKSLGLSTRDYAEYVAGVSDRQAEIAALVERQAVAAGTAARGAQGYADSVEGAVGTAATAAELAERNADARERGARAVEIENEALGRQLQVAREIREQIDARWADPGMGARYAASGGSRYP